ncbi:uncharacterized protein Z518_00282 [Rhinocladiella mackenziei CBS 650.93]|uniref:Uncharacterized protein n=1 Tax=Rhinocladiella mackenziei CBS 650.93 TaxID=1442369 RepID=A0A0D2HEV5_9EURO|nr:uncharacterized protein Z518_00282 [Rhinocladiella mackenziei CBS 650.93]KIX09203.1 hypothetical protein Z518_00282 [Rhinocladiella mackenziei CBS 650.93]
MAANIPGKGSRPILVGNVSGSTGDRLDALKLMLKGDTIVDAIIGDWLSEFNLASRALQARAGRKGGYEPGFLYSLREALDEYIDYKNQHLRIAVNAGGLNPRGLAEEVQKLLLSRGSKKKVAYVVGDNLFSQIDGLEIQPLTRATGDFESWRRKYPEIILASRMGPTSSSAGDVLTQARLAGSLVAGHLIECGCYVTGGNFGGFQTLFPNYYDLSFPIAAIAVDGTSIIQKQPNQNGIVTIDTVRGQFLYELRGIFYFNPDVVADFSRICFEQVGPDRVYVSGFKGMLAPETLKIAIMALGGYQAEFSVYVTGLDTKEKARSFEIMSRRMLKRNQYEVLDFQLYGTPKEDPQSQLESTLQLRVFAQAKDPKVLSAGRFLGPLMSNQLSGFPGLTPNLDFRTAEPKSICTYFPGLINQKHVQQRVYFFSAEDDEKCVSVPLHQAYTPVHQLPNQLDYQPAQPVPMSSFGPNVKAPLGLAVFARSGDKGANVNIGLFTPRGLYESEKYDWLRSLLTTEKFRQLLAREITPETDIERCEFPRIQAIHFVIHGILGAGVSSSVKMDALGHHFRLAISLDFCVRTGGVSVLSLDRATVNDVPVRTSDLLTRKKSSIQVNLKNEGGIRLVKDLAKEVDTLIDPFRPGVLEKQGLGPWTLTALNPGLILAHLLGNFAGGGFVCFVEIVLALLAKLWKSIWWTEGCFTATSPKLATKNRYVPARAQIIRLYQANMSPNNDYTGACWSRSQEMAKQPGPSYGPALREYQVKDP